MKKQISIALFFVLVLSLSACKSDVSKKQTGNTPNTVKETGKDKETAASKKMSEESKFSSGNYSISELSEQEVLAIADNDLNSTIAYEATNYYGRIDKEKFYKIVTKSHIKRKQAGDFPIIEVSELDGYFLSYYYEGYRYEYSNLIKVKEDISEFYNFFSGTDTIAFLSAAYESGFSEHAVYKNDEGLSILSFSLNEEQSKELLEKSYILSLEEENIQVSDGLDVEITVNQNKHLESITISGPFKATFCNMDLGNDFKHEIIVQQIGEPINIELPDNLDSCRDLT